MWVEIFSVGLIKYMYHKMSSMGDFTEATLKQVGLSKEQITIQGRKLV